MLIISGPEGCGINSLFPFFISENNKTISVVEWDCYRKRAPVLMIINFIYVVMLAALLLADDGQLRDQYFFALESSCFLYGFCRIKLIQKRIKISVRKITHKCVAPLMVWIEYFLFGASFVLIQSLALRLESEPVMHVILVSLQAVFAMYAILPVLNYFQYQRQRLET